MRRGRRRRGPLYRIVCALLIIAALIVGMSVFFRISTIEVGGLGIYTAEEVANASGIGLGDNMFFINKFDAIDKICAALPCVEEVSIRRRLPDTVVITVTESEPVAQIVTGLAWWRFDRSGKLVERAEASDPSLVTVSGITPIEPVVGQRIAAGAAFALNLDYMEQVLTLLQEKDMLSDVSELDASNLSDLSFRYLGRFTVLLGGNDETEYKLTLLPRIVERLDSGETGAIDLSEPRETHVIPD